MNPEPVNRKRNPSFHFIPVSHHQIHWFLDQPIPNLHQQLTQLPENQKLGQLRIRPRLHNRINRNRSKKKYKKYKKKKEIKDGLNGSGGASGGTGPRTGAAGRSSSRATGVKRRVEPVTPRPCRRLVSGNTEAQSKFPDGLPAVGVVAALQMMKLSTKTISPLSPHHPIPTPLGQP